MSEVPYDVRGNLFEMQILLLYCWVQQVLRALPAETKVDGLPRASSYLKMIASNVTQKLYVNLDGCLTIHMD